MDFKDDIRERTLPRGVSALKAVSDLDKESKPIVHVATVRGYYAVPLVLERAGMLGRFYTGIYLGDKQSLRRLLGFFPDWLKPSLLQRLEDRVCEGLPPGKIVSFDGLGLWNFWLRRRADSTSDLSAIYARANLAFCERVVRKGLDKGDAIYGFNGASLEIFRMAQEQGMSCILEQTLAPRYVERQLAKEEAERWPGWEPRMTFESDADPLSKREEAEWKLADRIVCGSEFVAQGLQALGVEAVRCEVVPYATDTERYKPVEKLCLEDGLNVLFVGQVQLRKGVPYLLEALRGLNSARIRCRLVGPVGLNPYRLAEYRRWVEIVGPLPYARVPEMYCWADVLVLPSLCEGSALVTYEALACGLPVITTPNAGSVVRNGEDGFIIPIRDSEALSRCMERLLLNRSLLSILSQNALQRSKGFTLEKYGERLLSVIQPLCRRQNPVAG